MPQATQGTKDAGTHSIKKLHVVFRENYNNEH